MIKLGKVWFPVQNKDDRRHEAKINFDRRHEAKINFGRAALRLCGCEAL